MERRMKKLLTVYNEIINDENTSLPNIFDINDINEIQPKFKWFNIYQIINEYVEDNELTPIPKKLFNKICKDIKTKEFQILTYSYNDIADLLTEYEYEFKNEFKANLVNGNLYIISSKQFTDDFFNQDEMYVYYSKLLKYFSEEEVEYILSIIQRSESGITSTINRFDPIEHKCVFIFINQNKIYKRSWTTTLEHELTHFIQRIVGESAFKRSKTIPGNGYGIYQNYKDFFDKIFNKQISNNLLEFIHYIIRNKEQDTSIKHILMNFQRYYEFQNKERSCHKNDIETKNINLNQRLTWLNNIFSQLNNKDYFLSETWKNNINLIKNDFESLTDVNKMNRNFIYAMIGFLIYEELLPERNVKNKLINHFKSFKFRDN
jgi:hypothetical protein